MDQDELHAQISLLAQFVLGHRHALEAEHEQDAEGYAILPKGADGDALRVLQDVSAVLAIMLYKIDNGPITFNDDD